MKDAVAFPYFITQSDDEKKSKYIDFCDNRSIMTNAVFLTVLTDAIKNNPY